MRAFIQIVEKDCVKFYFSNECILVPREYKIAFDSQVELTIQEIQFSNPSLDPTNYHTASTTHSVSYIHLSSLFAQLDKFSDGRACH
jgi:hypothetical protein